MSAANRKLIADAATTVDGIKCSPTYVAPTSPGMACVRLDHQAFDDFGSVVHWNVVLCLGQDQAAAEAYFEDKVPQIVAALSGVMAVQEARPQQLRLTDGTTVLAAFINGFREE